MPKLFIQLPEGDKPAATPVNNPEAFPFSGKVDTPINRGGVTNVVTVAHDPVHNPAPPPSPPDWTKKGE